MSGRSLVLCCALGLSSMQLARGAEPAPATATEPVVELPPMIVNETISPAHWLYAEVHGDEYLSRCSRTLTRDFIAKRERAWRRLLAIVPDEFLAHLPSITILADTSVAPKSGDLVAREVLDTGSRVTVQYLPNLRIDSRDSSALFSYLDEGTFGETEMAITAGYLRSLLERHTPMLPPWLIEGVMTLRGQLVQTETSVTLQPLRWLSLGESLAIAHDPARPRALLPANELFAPDALRGEDNRHPRRVETMQAQAALLVRWALDPRNQVRDAFWKFVRLASEQRVTEEMFTNCFGFGFSDLRDRLNDYLPLAVVEPLSLASAAGAEFAAPGLVDASPLAIARLRGSWERLEIGYVRRSHPDFAERYVLQAQHTLRVPYEQGNQNAWLLAEIGLCEIDAGDPAAGGPFLEKAMAAGAVRPQAGYELARLRFAGLLRGQPSSRLFSSAEIAPVVEPLRLAAEQPPPLPEVFSLLADAWLQTREPVPPADLAALRRGGKLFAMDPALSYRIALILVRAGHPAEAGELLATGIEYATNEALRTRYAQLQSAVASAKTP